MTYQACFPTPYTVFGIRCTEKAVTEIEFLPISTPTLAPTTPLAESVCEALQQYFFDPHYIFDLPLAIEGTAFQRRVWSEIRRIPSGETISYAELALRVGSGARAVANACGANSFPIIIPCHRIVAAHGLGGFMRGRKFAALDIKRWLLSHERSATGVA